MFRSDLWQKESAIQVIDDQESVAANLDGFGMDWLQRGEQGNLYARVLELGFFHGSKARIFQGSAYSTADDSIAYGFARFRHSNASLQTPSYMKGDEDSTTFRENPSTRDEVWKFTVSESFADRFAR